MSIEEKLKAINLISSEKETVEKKLAELEAVEPSKLQFISVNGGSQILVNEKASAHLWHLLHAFLTNEKTVLMERATELMK
jgi:hypothetical protein